MNSIEEFLRSKDHNAWIDLDPVSAYVRKSLRCIELDMVPVFDLASFSVEEQEQGKGHFKNFIIDLEKLLESTKYEFLYLENVLNPILITYLPKIGFVTKDKNMTIAPCFYKKINRI